MRARIFSSQRHVWGRGWRPTWLEMNKWNKWEKGSGNNDDFVNVSVIFEQRSGHCLAQGGELSESGSCVLSTPAAQAIGS